MLGINEIIDACRSYSKNSDVDRVSRAYEYAKRGHKGVRRQSGEPYVQHPLRVVQKLIKLKADCDTLCAALLHDVPEDTDLTLADIKK